jgi:hypothetical protein
MEDKKLIRSVFMENRNSTDAKRNSSSERGSNNKNSNSGQGRKREDEFENANKKSPKRKTN